MIQADWSKLVFKRDPSVLEYADYYGNATSSFRRFTSDYFWNSSSRTGPLADLADAVADYPETVAAILHELGYDAYDILDAAEAREIAERDYWVFRYANL